MVGRRSWWSLFASVALLVVAIGGCEAIFQFDEDKLGTSSTSNGGGGTGGSAGATTQGGGGSTTHGGGGTGATAGMGGTGAIGPGGSTGGTGGVTPECTTAADCPDSGSECVLPACVNQACVTENVPADTVSATQTDGDCKLAVCDGQGNIITKDDDTDAFDDGKDCTLDTCNAGTPESSSATAGTTCNDDGGKVCDGSGACVVCNLDTDCMAPTPKCSMNVCVPSSCNDGVKNGNETDKDCGGACGATCLTGNVCGVAGDCVDGVCSNGTCAAAACNDGVKNGSETDKDCGGGAPCSKCAPNKSCNVNADCVGNQCSGAGGTCVPNCNDGVKNNAEVGVDCGGGTCAGCSIGGPCAQDNDCASGAYCDPSQTCVTKKTLGTACLTNNQCAAGNCVDGVCCNTTCAGLCQTCALPGAVGTCSPLPAGQDPIDECAGAASVCNGAAACKKANGQTCAAAGDCALGLCVDGYCCNSGCVGTCIACNVAGFLGTCSPVPAAQDPANECAGAVNCNGNGACGSLLGNGTACAIGNECQSGNCIDGVCCNSTCSGLCQACNVAGSAGACTSIPNGQDPANECASGACNGAALCKLDNGQACAAGSACLSTTCVDGVCCNALCSGTCQACNVAGSTGTCSSIANGQDPASECSGAVSCNGAGACGYFANGASCSLGAECTSGNCVDGVCCNTACSGTCQACNVAGSVGACSSIASGQDPANECANGACSGAGTCKSDNGQACAAGSACLSGNCIDGVCCNTTCSGTCQACNVAGSVGTCSNIPFGQDPANECVGLVFCSMGACAPLGGGSICSQNAECASGNCVDGVCCNTACGGTCQACNLAGSNGTCTNIPANSDPSNECNGATNCNGAGACSLLAQGSACGAAGECSTGFCVDGFCCNSACTGLCKSCSGAYNLNGDGICGNIECADPQNECSGAATCVGNGTCGANCL